MSSLKLPLTKSCSELLRPVKKPISGPRARRRRARGVRVDERLVDPADRRVEAGAGRRVVADVAVRQRRAVVVPVEARRRVADVALEDDVADRDLGVVRVREDLLDAGEHALRLLVDERVRPHVAGGVRHEPVREGEHLALLLRGVARVVLRRPGPVQDVTQPLAGVHRVDDGLPHRQVGEAVRADDAGVVVRRPVVQRLRHLARYRVLAAGDRDVAVGRVCACLVPGVVVRVRLEALRTGRNQ